MNDLELIRRFRSQVEPPDAERTAAARARLAAEFAPAPDAARRRVLTRPRLTALASVPALAAAVAALILGPLGGDGTQTAGAAIIHRARAALVAAPHEILHTKVAGDGFESDWWQLTSPPHSFVGDKGPVGAAATEEAADGTSSSYYDPAANTIHELASGAPPQFGDPIAQVRQRLDAGRARLLGSAEVDGVATYKIQFEGKDGYDSQSLIAYVDQHTYRPIVLDDPQRNGTVVRLRVVTFEYLPATDANLRLLSLTARHPSARVVHDTSEPARPAGK